MNGAPRSGLDLPKGNQPLSASTRAGTPTAVEQAGTSRVTTAFAPIRAWSPIVTGPRILAPAPISTCPPSVTPPVIVTCWNNRQFTPIRAAGCTTTPLGWGSSSPPRSGCRAECPRRSRPTRTCARAPGSAARAPRTALVRPDSGGSFSATGGTDPTSAGGLRASSPGRWADGTIGYVITEFFVATCAPRSRSSDIALAASGGRKPVHVSATILAFGQHPARGRMQN